MRAIIKLVAMSLVVIGLSGCGKMGELEPVRTQVAIATDLAINHA